MEAILVGVYICLAVQILVVGIANLYQKEHRNKILGIFCFLLIFSLIKRAFWENIEGSGLYCVFGGPHEILYAPLLYVYLLVSDKKSNPRNGYKHILVAFFTYLALHLVAIFFFRGAHQHIAPFFLSSIIIFSIWYFIKGLKLYREQLKNKLKTYPKFRFQFFYLSANLYILLKAFVIAIALLNAIVSNDVIKDIYTNFSIPVFLYIVVPLFVLLCLAYLFYGLTEINSLKKTILTVDIHKKEGGNKSDYNKVWKALENEEVFRNPEINVNSFTEKFDLNKSTVSQFLRDNDYENFQDLINRFRVQNFKNRVQNNQFENYDLVGIAKECGFKSKATFYRVFKKYENCTPGEYLERTSL